MRDIFFHVTRSPRVVQESSTMALDTQAPSIFLPCHPQKIGSLMVTIWLLHLQALYPGSRQGEEKEAKEKRHMPVGFVTEVVIFF